MSDNMAYVRQYSLMSGNMEGGGGGMKIKQKGAPPGYILIRRNFHPPPPPPILLVWYVGMPLTCLAHGYASLEKCYIPF